MAESFFASLECELIDRRSCKTKAEARLAVFTWIEAWYNPRRRPLGAGPDLADRTSKGSTLKNASPTTQCPTRVAHRRPCVAGATPPWTTLHRCSSRLENQALNRPRERGNITAKTLSPILKAHVAKSARLMTDEAGAYKKPGRHFASHETVNHSKEEYARGDVSSNTAESSFAILKRGLVGTFHSVSEQHLQRYANEFDFRWNTRISLGFNDAQRFNCRPFRDHRQAPDISAA